MLQTRLSRGRRRAYRRPRGPRRSALRFLAAWGRTLTDEIVILEACGAPAEQVREVLRARQAVARYRARLFDAWGAR